MAPKLIVEVLGDTSRLEKSFKRAGREATGFGSSLGRLSVGFGQLAKGVIEVDILQKAFEGLHSAVDLGIEGFSDTQRVAAQTVAVLKSTGGAANISADKVHALAASLSNLSGIDDEVIQSGENILLSFTQIRDFAGKNNDIFTQATKVITDYASRTGKAMSTSATIIGRALADPATKAVALSRAGIVLTKSQLDGLKAIEKTSGVVAAQKVLLGDLEKRYQGAAEAAGKTLPGQLNILRERFKDLAGEIVGNVTPGLKGFVTELTATVVKITQTAGFRAKLSVLWTGVDEAAHGAEDALKRAIGKVDWTAVWAGANGIAAGLAARLKAVDWSAVGASIGDGIAKSVSVAASATKSIAGKLENIFKAIDWVKLGKAAGPGLAAALVTAFATITDPTFWIKNWDLALAVGSVAFAGPLGRLGGRLLEPFAKLGADLIGRFGSTLAEGAVGAIERLGTKLVEGGRPVLASVGRLIQGLASVFLDGLLKLPGIADRALAGLVAPFVRAFSRLGGLTRFTIKVLGAQAAIDAVANVVRKIGGLFGQLANVIGNALDGAWKQLESGAIKAALAIVEPFTHIPTALVGNKFQEIKTVLQAELNGMVASAQEAGPAIFAALTPTPAQARAIAALAPPSFVTGTAIPPGGVKAAGSVPRNIQDTVLPAVPIPKPSGGLTATQKNTFFDNAISSDLTRAGFITNIKAQIGALQNIAGLISARIAATKDVTRRRTLEDQLLSVDSQITGDRQQVAQDFLTALQFGVTKAQATASFKDDIKAITALQDGIKAEIKATGTTIDLQGQLLQTQQDLVTARNNARNATQFKALGLTATGDTVTPGVKRLKGELSTLTGAITGTFLDTSKTQSVLSQLSKVLSSGLGVVGQQVRQKVQDIIDGLNNQLKGNAANLSKFQHVSSAALIAGLGLSPDIDKALRSRISQLGPNGTIPGSHSAAFASAPSGGQSGGGVTINGDIHLHGITDLKDVEAGLIKLKRRRAPRRTGPSTGIG